MATFGEDSRILFEANDGEIHLLLTDNQETDWFFSNEEDNRGTLEEILLFYLQYLKKEGK
jgi:hypothetical protein